jgi:hypothetical protein
MAPPTQQPTGFASAPPAWSGKPTRPGWVTFVGVVDFIGGGAGILIGLVVAVAGSAFAAAFGGLGTLFSGLLAVLGVIIIVLGILYILLGVQVLKGRNWARIVNIVFAILGLVGAVFSIARGNFGSIVSLALDGLIVFALFRPESKAFFGARPGAAVGAAPA